jgi:hypothetical protein
MECDHVRCENKVETIKGIHLLNLLGENSPKGVQKPSQKNHLPINVACIEMPIRKNQKKVQGLNLAHSLLRKTRNNHLM